MQRELARRRVRKRTVGAAQRKKKNTAWATRSGRKRETKKPPRDYTSTASLLPTPVDSAPPLCLKTHALSLYLAVYLSLIYRRLYSCSIHFCIQQQTDRTSRATAVPLNNQTVFHHVVRCQFHRLPVVVSLQKFRSVSYLATLFEKLIEISFKKRNIIVCVTSILLLLPRSFSTGHRLIITN